MSTLPETEIKSNIEVCRSILAAEKPKKIDISLKRDLKAGWMMPYLLQTEGMLWGRWDYWFDAMLDCKLPDRPIPKIVFNEEYNASSQALKHFEFCLNLVSPGDWRGWSSWHYVDFFLSWLLWGFGHKGYEELPPEPSDHASIKLYQGFNLGWPLCYPHDYFGWIMAEGGFGRKSGFFPTPHCIVELMTQLNFRQDLDEESDAAYDQRLQAVNDPCVGSGRMLLHASNYSVNLSGCDINPTVIKACLVNGYLYAPWLVKPFPFLKHEAEDNQTKREAQAEQRQVIETALDALTAKEIATTAVEQISLYKLAAELESKEAPREQIEAPREVVTEKIKKKDDRQGSLFD